MSAKSKAPARTSRSKKVKELRYTIDIETPTNGRIRSSTIVVRDASGKVVASTKGDLGDAAKRRRVARDLHRDLPDTDEKTLLRAITAKWNEILNQQQRLRELMESGSPEAVPDGRAASFSANEHSGPYKVKKGRICRVRTFDGQETVEELCNFAAKIEEEVSHDDGAEVKHNFTISGQLDNGRTLPDATVAANNFPAMNWVVESWGSQAIVNAGQGARDHLRCAIQRLSFGSASRRTVYGHAGWRRINGEWCPTFTLAARLVRTVPFQGSRPLFRTNYSSLSFLIHQVATS
jgi:hypothetical protein